MFDTAAGRLLMKVFTLAMLLLSLFLFSQDSTKSLLASPHTGQEKASEPGIIIATGDDSPLRIVSTSILSAEPQNFRLRVMIQNQGLKGIRAYALTSEAASDKTRSGYTDFMNLRQKDTIWQPTVIKTTEVSDARSEPILSVKLTVDFVEFTDGTTWGPDAQHSSDILAGQRAGARLETQRLRQLLKGKGWSAVAADIQTPMASDLKALAGSNHSSEWLEGFRSGISAIRGRLRQAGQSASPVKPESELDKPFDTSEENPR